MKIQTSLSLILQEHARSLPIALRRSIGPVRLKWWLKSLGDCIILSRGRKFQRAVFQVKILEISGQVSSNEECGKREK